MNTNSKDFLHRNLINNLSSFFTLQCKYNKVPAIVEFICSWQRKIISKSLIYMYTQGLINMHMLCCAYSLSHVLLFAIPWTVAYQAPLSTGFSSKNTDVDCHFFLQRIFLIQGLNLGLLNWQVDSLPYEPPKKPIHTIIYITHMHINIIYIYRCIHILHRHKFILPICMYSI